MRLQTLIYTTLSSSVLVLCAACQTPNPQARVTGDSGGRLLKLSSKQTTIDLTDAEKAALAAFYQSSERSISTTAFHAGRRRSGQGQYKARSA